MADPVLVTYIRLEGAEKVQASLKTIEKQGEKIAAQGGKWQSSVTAISTAYTALSLAIGQATRTIGSFVQAARDDEASQVRRNVALQQAIGYTESHTRALDAQADMYSKTFGISDDYTREIQTQWAALGANADSVERLTRLSINMAEIMHTDASTAVVRLTNAFSGNTDAVKGTTLRFKDHESTLERVAKAEEFAATGADMLTEKMKTGEGASDRYKVAVDELKESFGRLGNTAPVVTGINNIADGINDLVDVINGARGPVSNFGTILGFLVGGIPGAMNMASFGKGFESASYPIQAMVNGKLQGFKTYEEMAAATGTGGGGDVSFKWPKDEDKKRGGAKGSRIGPEFDFLAFGGVPTLDDFIAMYVDMARIAANRVTGNMYAGGWSDNQRGGIVGQASLFAPALDYPRLGMLGGWNSGNIFGMAAGAAGVQARARAAGMGGGGWADSMGGAFGSITGAADRIRPGGPGWWDKMQSAFGPQGLAAVAGGFASGGVGGGLSSALSVAGGAFGPLGALAGGLLGKAFGGLFGGGKKRQGETPAQPIYTSDMNLARLVTDLLNITKMSLVRGASAGIDSSVKALNTQNARAGV